LDAVRHYAPGAKLVYPGSRLEYGRVAALPVPEDVPMRPTNPYGIHKLAAELHHLHAFHIYGTRSTVLRLTIPFGANATPTTRDFGIANRFIQLAVEDGELPIYGDGAQVRDYVYVDDAVAALALAGATTASDGAVYNVGGGAGIALADFARLAVECAGAGRLRFLPWPELALKVETGDFVADVSHIRAALGWRPAVSLREGVQRTVEQLRRHSSPPGAGVR
jgi:nucleoside-diphosphate-sugar epimerase